jgi:hypothetical protein
MEKLVTALVWAAALCAAAESASAQSSDALYGTWRLIGFTVQDLASGQITRPWGGAPTGFLSYSRDGRMYAILAREQRPKPADMSKLSNEQRAELFNSMAAYAGTFSYDGKTVTHHVDISWNENWTGTAQKRLVKLEGRKLYITTPPAPSGVDGKPVVIALEWEKVEPR